MAPPQDALLIKICSKQETLSRARELLNLAKARTGPGSGHQLGAGALGLPAICACLASQLAGNDDVSEKVAQQASCLAPRVFATALNTVRAALGSSLQKGTRSLGTRSSSTRSSRGVTFQSLCREYGVDEDAVAWMEQAHKATRMSDLFEKAGFEPNSEIVRCSVFYWVSAALRVRSVKISVLMSEYDIQRKDFRTFVDILDKTCLKIRTEIDSQMDEARSTRSSRTSSPVKLGVSPSKRSSISTPEGRTSSNENSPLKRKSSLDVFTLPTTPAKKLKVYSSRWKRENEATTSSPVKPRASAVASPASSPLKRSGTVPLPEASHPHPATRSNTNSLESPLSAAVSKRMKLLAIADEETAAASLPASSPAAGPSTPQRGRPSSGDLASPTADADIEMAPPLAPEMDEDQDESESSDDELPQRPRNLRPVFRDRQFYCYRDPRVVAEWEACEKHVKRLVQRLGHPFADLKERAALQMVE